jgi:transcription elongation factor GreA
MAETHLSQEAWERLQAEREDLVTRGRVEMARAIEAARALGDLAENADYHAAKDAQGKMEARIRQINLLLADAQILDPQTMGETVGAGTVVSLRYEGDDDVERYLIGSIEERRENLPVISPGSPLGKVLLGHHPGDIVEYEAPSGTLRVEIVGVGT